MKKNTVAIIAIIMALLMLISGCGQKGDLSGSDLNNGLDSTEQETLKEADKSNSIDISSDANSENASESTTDNGVTGVKETDYSKPLSVSLCWDFYNVEEAAEKFKQLHPEFEINVTKYSNDYEKYTAQVSTNLMAGTSDDLLDGTGIKFKDAATVNLLADFYPLMKQDSKFNENDYFMNVFKALEYKGGLYTFPASFAYTLVAVNNQVSENLVSEFTKHDRLSVLDLMDIYKTAGVPGYYVHDSFDVLTALNWVMDSFVDLENKSCDFNNSRFINFLNDAKQFTEPEKQLGYSYASDVYSPEEEATRSKKYLFQQFNSDVYQYLLEFDTELSFVNHIPFTNEKGQLLISPLKNFCISAQSENKELAWEFIRFMASEESIEQNEGYMFIPSNPVNKKLYTYKAETDIPGRITYFENEYGWHIKGSAEEQTQNIITITNEINNMSMYYDEFNLYSIIMEPLEKFANGTLSAEQTASELQNKVSLALME